MTYVWIPFLSLLAVEPIDENPLKMTMHEMTVKAQSLSDALDGDRIEELDALAAWVASQPANTPTELTFICTHNSRRSHMGQIWAQAAAWHFGLNDVRTFSGGTEATAFNLSAVRAMRELGVIIQETEGGENPVYTVQLQEGFPAFEVFSKTYGHEANPARDFAAVMVCGSADAGCPVVFGAASRFSIPYVDPKVSDGTEAESATYRARSLEIGTEMFYVMARAAELRAE